MSHLADNLLRLRERCGLSLRDLSSLIGVSHAALSRWENGLNEPSARDVVALSRALGCTVSELLGVDDEQHVRDRADGIYEVEPPSRVMPVIGWVHAGSAEFPDESVVEAFPVRTVDWHRTDRLTRIVGDCMDPLLRDGDYVGIQRVSDPMQDLREHQDVLICVTPSEGTVCRWFGGWLSYGSSRSILLLPENHSYRPMVLPTRDCRIVGRVTWSHREW